MMMIRIWHTAVSDEHYALAIDIRIIRPGSWMHHLAFEILNSSQRRQSWVAVAASARYTTVHCVEANAYDTGPLNSRNILTLSLTVHPEAKSLTVKLHIASSSVHAADNISCLNLI